MNFKKFLGDFSDWLKYICFNFFHNGYARSGAKRSLLNVVFGVAVGVVLICGGLTVGYNASFGTHYENADKFRQFAYSALGGEQLSFEDGKLCYDGDRIETLSDKDSPYRINGYELVVDTRPAAETFDDFTIICADGDGKEITYDEYAALPAKDRAGYKLSLRYSGVTLDTSAKQDVYRAHLDKASDRDGGEYKSGIAEEYNFLKEKEASGELSGKKLHDAVYKLYAKSYYPSFDKVESYASVPTVRSYYISKLSENKYGKYLVLFDEYCLFSFYTENGIAVSFSGGYAAAEGAVAGEQGIDGIILGAFDSNASANFLVFASDMVFSVLVFVLIALVASVAFAGLSKKQGLEYTTSTGIFNLMGGFLPVSGIVAFVFGAWLPFSLSVRAAYLTVRLIFLAVVFARFGVLLVMDIINKKKEKRAVPAAAAEAVADPFAEEIDEK